MRPRIGITCSFNSNKEPTERLQSHLLAGYSDGIYAVGGLPHAIPVPDQPNAALLDEIIARCDGLMLTGGYDLMPSHFGQELHARTHLMHERRDRFELELLRRADARRTPIFGVCLGHQVAHVARGGRLVQHVDDLGLSPTVCHYLPGEANAFHDVQIEPDSRLVQIVGDTRLEVSSRHHQIVDGAHPGHGLCTTATSADGVIEASEDLDGRFLLTVQWHPEDLLDRREHLNLFAALVEEAARSKNR